MWTDDDLRSLTPDERMDLAQRLAELSGPMVPATPKLEHRRRLFVDFLVLCCTVLIPWIVILAFTLPPRYVVGHWQATWVGFDIFELIGLAVTAWAGWRRRQIVIVAALITGTLLVTDAWFDVLTASGTSQRLLSLADAVVIELPVAILLFVIAGRLIRLTVSRTRTLAGSEGATPPFWKVPLFAVDPPGSADPPDPADSPNPPSSYS